MIIYNGIGGAAIVWQDYRSGQWDIYAKNIAASIFTPTPTVASTPLMTATPTPEIMLASYVKIINSKINPNRNEEAVIHWSQPQSGPVTITIYNLQGEKVATLVDRKEYPAGQYHELVWNGSNQHGRIAGSGIYIAHIKAGGWQDKAKICVLK